MKVKRAEGSNRDVLKENFDFFLYHLTEITFWDDLQIKI